MASEVDPDAARDQTTAKATAAEQVPLSVDVDLADWLDLQGTRAVKRVTYALPNPFQVTRET